MSRRAWVYLADGCATGWAECPRVDPVTVTRDGDRLTTCIERTELEVDK